MPGWHLRTSSVSLVHKETFSSCVCWSFGFDFCFACLDLALSNNAIINIIVHKMQLFCTCQSEDMIGLLVFSCVSAQSMHPLTTCAAVWVVAKFLWKKKEWFTIPFFLHANTSYEGRNTCQEHKLFV
jgi:hypothetical protein